MHATFKSIATLTPSMIVKGILCDSCEWVCQCVHMFILLQQLENQFSHRLLLEASVLVNIGNKTECVCASVCLLVCVNELFDVYVLCCLNSYTFMTVLLYISGLKHAVMLTDRSQTFKPKTRAVFLKVNSYHTLDCKIGLLHI